MKIDTLQFTLVGAKPMFVRVSFICAQVLASYLGVEKYPPTQSRRVYRKDAWQISAQRRANTGAMTRVLEL